MVVFFEKLGIFSLVRNVFQNREITFYWLKSFPLRAFERVLPGITGSLCKKVNLKHLEWGDTHYLDNVFRDATTAASESVSLFIDRSRKTLTGYRDLFGIDFELILRKYLLAIYLFEKYLRYELFLQYIKENPGKGYIVYFDPVLSGPYESALRRVCTTKKLAVFKNTEYFFSMIGIIGSYLVKWKRIVTSKYSLWTDQVLCYVTRPDEFYYEKNLFSSIRNIHFLTYDTYRETFKDVSDENLEVQAPAFSPDAYATLKKDTARYIRMLLSGWRDFSGVGWHAVQIYNSIMFSRSYIPEGGNNTFLVFEHHDLMKTIRNEFIRSTGNRVIFFPYSNGFALRYYPQEFYARYDLIFSSGKYLEDHFRESRAIDPVFVKTGCAVAHIQQEDAGYRERLKGLVDKKAGRTVITILCPGVCRPTYYSEIDLMELARKLADTTSIKVFIRQKPFIPEQDYQGFYESFTEGKESMYLTGMEYELFDFLPVTDLFVTTYSTSACEVAMRGGNIFFVDFMKHPDRTLFWKDDISGSILLDGDEAFEKITAWINDTPDGPVRTVHKEARSRFVDYISYFFPGDEFKRNVIKHLEQAISGSSTKEDQVDV